MDCLNKFNFQTDQFWGLIEAPVQLIQYGDFLCEHCGDVYPVIKLLQEKMGNNLLFIFRHYPVYTMHHLSLEAAMAAEAAALQGKFWYMHDMIFENQKHLVRSSFAGFAEAINLDIKMFEDSRGHKQLFHKVMKDRDNGVRYGVNATPTFFINGQRHTGFDDFDSLYNHCKHACSRLRVAV